MFGGFVISRPKKTIYSNVGDKFGLRLISDAHIDASNTDIALLKRELEDAKSNGDRILLNGDTFDAILPKDAKRYETHAVCDALVGRQDVLNGALDIAEDLFSPYASNIDMIGVGNHEYSVFKYHSVDLVSLLINRLNRHKKESHIIHHGGYTGFVDYRFSRKNSSDTLRTTLWYHHGYGMSAGKSMGVLQFSGVEWVKSDIRWMGHLHAKTYHVDKTMTCPLSGVDPKMKNVINVRTASYRLPYKGTTQDSIRNNGLKSNYELNAGFKPQGTGGFRIGITICNYGLGYSVEG